MWTIKILTDSNYWSQCKEKPCLQLRQKIDKTRLFHAKWNHGMQ